MQRQDGQVVLSNWHLLMDAYATSTQDFYRQVEDALKARELPSDVTFERVTHREWGMLSAEREYLRVRRENIAFDICAAPYGNGFFFSWWLSRIPGKHFGTLMFVLFATVIYLTLAWNIWDGGCGSLVAIVFVTGLLLTGLGVAIREGSIGSEETLLELPVIGWLYRLIFSPVTYYRLDTAIMFRESVRRSVNEVIGTLRSEQGLRKLTPDELKPHMDHLV
ncbi:MAG: hypothetical protein AAGD01_10630 [Acidobacteriota bacterium]